MKILNNVLYIEKDERYINLKNTIMVAKIIQGDKSKIAFNFENIVSNKNDDYLIPEFHYMFLDYNELENTYEQLSKILVSYGFIEFETLNGKRFINPNKINSFYFKDNILYLNLNSSLNTLDKKLSSLSLKCSNVNKKDIEKLIENIL